MWAFEPPGLACLAQSIRALVAFPRDASPSLLPSCWLASRSRQRLHGSPRRPPTVPGLHRPLIGAQCSSTPTVIHPYSGLEVLPVISRRSCSQLRDIPTILSFLFIVGTCISQFTIHPYLVLSVIYLLLSQDYQNGYSPKGTWRGAFLLLTTALCRTCLKLFFERRSSCLTVMEMETSLLQSWSLWLKR